MSIYSRHSVKHCILVLFKVTLYISCIIIEREPFKSLQIIKIKCLFIISLYIIQYYIFINANVSRYVHGTYNKNTISNIFVCLSVFLFRVFSETAGSILQTITSIYWMLQEVT